MTIAARGFGILAALLLMTSVASAHVTLDPKEAVPGFQRYSVNVPVEKDIATTELRLVVPENVEIHGVLPVAGWTHAEKRADTDATASDDHGDAAHGRITEITWTGGKINPGEYVSFGVSTRYQGDPATLTWKAYQKYADGSVVAWDGSDTKFPAPAVTVIKENKIDTLTNAVNSQGTPTSNQAPLWFSFAAVLFSVAAFMIALRKK
jgi:uncharacterized protein YcnI